MEKAKSNKQKKIEAYYFRTNPCAENAQAERLNGILKGEYLLDQTFLSTEQARQACRQAIQLYNRDRPHLSLNYQTPDHVHQAA